MRTKLLQLAKRVLNALGLDIVRFRSPLESNLGMDEVLGFEFENEATDCIRLIRKNTMLSKRRLVTLFQHVAYCERYEISGAFVECGVWKGGAAGMMALANLRTGRVRRPIHLFDAFSEICEPDAAVDGDKALRDVSELTGRTGHDKGELRPLIGIYDFVGGPGTIEECRELLEQAIGYPSELIYYHVGWFQETLPADHDTIGAIAILRLDGDWYASTKVCLEYLFDKVARGGIVIIDDYGTYDGCRRAVDEYLESARIQAYLGSIDSDCRYFVKL